MSGPTRCPLCGSGISGTRCGVCRADLGGPEARELAAIDQQLSDLAGRRQQVLARLGEEAKASSAAPATAALPGWSRLPPPPAPPSDGAGLPPFLAPYPPAVGFPGGTSAMAGSPGPQVSSILLSLGTALLVIAALVFAAVTWSRVGPLGQGALLVGLTVAAGFGTHRAARRGLTGTAEALGVLTVLMGPLVAQALRITAGLVAVDDRTWANWGSWTWWPAVVLLVGGAAVVFGRAVTVRSPQWLGAALVQLGLPLWTTLAPLPTWAKVAIVTAQAAVVGSVVARRAVASVTGPVWWVGAVATWFWAAVATFSMVGDHDLTASVRWPVIAGLAALAAAATVASWAWTDTPNRRDESAKSALGAGLVAVVLVLAGSLTAAAAAPAASVVGALAALIVDRFGGRRRVALAMPCWLLVGLTAFPTIALGLLAALHAAGMASDPVWGSSFGARPLIGMTGSEATRQAAGQNPASVLVTVIALAVTLLSDPGWRRRTTVHATMAGAGVIVLVAVPPLAGMSLGATTLLLLAAAATLAVAMIWPGPAALTRPVALVGASVLFVMAGVWALGTQPLTMVAVAVGLVLATLVVLVALRSDDEMLAGPATVVAATALVVEVGLVVFAAGGSPSWAITGSALVAALAVTVLPVGETTEGRLPARSMVLLAAAMASALLHAGALVALSASGDGDPAPAAPLTVALAVGAVAWSVAAARRPLRASTVRWVALAAVEWLILVWFRLAHADVAVLEAYTVPSAVLVAVVMVMMAKVGGGLRTTPSWSLEGPALALALWPTALIALGDPGLTRQLVGLVAGAAVLAGGAVWRRRALVDVGGAAVAVLGLQALLPYVADVPRWISLGLVGIVLVGLGATFEQRRRDFDEARRHYVALR